MSKTSKKTHVYLIAAIVVGLMLAVLYFSLPMGTFGTRWHGTPDFGVDKRGIPKSDPLRFLRKITKESNLPGSENIAVMPSNDKDVVIHNYLDNADIVCNKKLRMGLLDDGGWEVCDDYAWRPIPPCIVYSFGINYDFSFDDNIARLYGCHVYSFDPSMDKQPTYQRSERVMFYRLGLGGHYEKNNTKGWTMYSFSGLRSMLHHTDEVIDVVKMDVEGAEWVALPSMVREGQLRNVRQLCAEFHLHSAANNTKQLQILADLETIGFRKFYVHKNQYCKFSFPMYPIVRTRCYEVHFVNTRFARADRRRGGWLE